MPVRSTATPGETDRITRQTNWPFITASPWLQCTAEGSPLQNSGRMNSAASSAIHQIRQTQLCNNTCKCAPTYVLSRRAQVGPHTRLPCTRQGLLCRKYYVQRRRRTLVEDHRMIEISSVTAQEAVRVSPFTCRIPPTPALEQHTHLAYCTSLHVRWTTQYYTICSWFWIKIWHTESNLNLIWTYPIGGCTYGVGTWSITVIGPQVSWQEPD